MVNQDVVEDSGHFTQLVAVNKKHCHYYLVDRLPQTLKNSAAVQEEVSGTITHAKTCSEDQDQQQRGRQERFENHDQVTFNESEWEVSALLRLLQHPDLRFGINASLVDTLLGGLPEALDTH